MWFQLVWFTCKFYLQIQHTFITIVYMSVNFSSVYLRNLHRSKIFFGINLTDIVKTRCWPKLLWDKCMNPLSKQNYKYGRCLYTSVVTASTDFYTGLNSIVCALVCTARWTVSFPINLQRISYLRYKVFGLLNNQKATVMVVYAENVVWGFFFLIS